jgi:hypothetical protein
MVADNKEASEPKFLVATLPSPLRKFHSRHPDLVNRCGIFVSQMTTCSVCGYRNPIISSYKSNPTGAACGGETAYPQGTPDINPAD